MWALEIGPQDWFISQRNWIHNSLLRRTYRFPGIPLADVIKVFRGVYHLEKQLYSGQQLTTSPCSDCYVLLYLLLLIIACQLFSIIAHSNVSHYNIHVGKLQDNYCNLSLIISGWRQHLRSIVDTQIQSNIKQGEMSQQNTTLYMNTVSVCSLDYISLLVQIIVTLFTKNSIQSCDLNAASMINGRSAVFCTFSCSASQGAGHQTSNKKQLTNILKATY